MIAKKQLLVAIIILIGQCNYYLLPFRIVLVELDPLIFQLRF